jgi:hypothetical protein
VATKVMIQAVARADRQRSIMFEPRNPLSQAILGDLELILSRPLSFHMVKVCQWPGSLSKMFLTDRKVQISPR